MARLMPNPIADLREPLDRIEASIKELPVELSDIRTLPLIHQELVELNERMDAVLAALEGRAPGTEGRARSR